MHPYLPHLLSDITAAHRTEPSLPIVAKTFEEQMEEVERWVAGVEEPHTLGYYCGLAKENFPPSEQLTEEDLLLVCEALKKMMYSYNIGIDLPDELPAPLRYGLIVGTLNEKTAIPDNGVMHFDFCTGNAPECVLKEYCPCLKIWNETEDDNTSEH